MRYGGYLVRQAVLCIVESVYFSEAGALATGSADAAKFL